MKTTTAFLFLATLAFSSCVLLASAQDEEWYDPNADYVPQGYDPVVNSMGYYLNCAEADKNYFTLLKLDRCQDPYVLSSQNIQSPNSLGGYINRICQVVENQWSRDNIPVYPDNQWGSPFYNNQRFQPGYPGYPWTFAQMKSTEETSTTTSTKKSPSKQSVLDATPAFLQHKMKQYAANAAAIEAAKQQKQQQQQDQQDQVLLETEAKTKTTYPDDFNGPYYGYYTQEDCVNALVLDPAFRDPVTATDIERLLVFDILFFIYADQLKRNQGNPDYVQYSEDRCKTVLLPMFLRTGHFPGDGVTDNLQAKHDFFLRSLSGWYEQYVYTAFDYMCYYW